jgi:hypothetical protein
MTRVIFAIVAALASVALDSPQAVGVEAPWCAVTKEGDHWDCRYISAVECQLNVVAGKPWLVQSEPLLRCGAHETSPCLALGTAGCLLCVISGHFAVQSQCLL